MVFYYGGQKKTQKKKPKRGRKNKTVSRPPRVYYSTDGRPYIVVNGKPRYINAQNMNNKQIQRIVINNFERRKGRRTKSRAKPGKGEGKEIEGRPLARTVTPINTQPITSINFPSFGNDALRIAESRSADLQAQNAILSQIGNQIPGIENAIAGNNREIRNLANILGVMPGGRLPDRPGLVPGADPSRDPLDPDPAGSVRPAGDPASAVGSSSVDPSSFRPVPGSSVGGPVPGWYVPGPPGPAGPVGPAGPAGRDGVDGAMGPAGPVGPQGERGEMGPMGPLGPQGERGEMGPMGPLGPIGPQGERGEIGPIGPQGERGEVGPMGPQGERGVRGFQGVRGPLGPVGPQGVAGEQGPQGEPGVRGPPGPANAQDAFSGLFNYDLPGEDEDEDADVIGRPRSRTVTSRLTSAIGLPITRGVSRTREAIRSRFSSFPSEESPYLDDPENEGTVTIPPQRESSITRALRDAREAEEEGRERPKPLTISRAITRGTQGAKRLLTSDEMRSALRTTYDSMLDAISKSNTDSTRKYLMQLVDQGVQDPLYNSLLKGAIQTMALIDFEKLKTNDRATRGQILGQLVDKSLNEYQRTARATNKSLPPASTVRIDEVSDFDSIPDVDNTPLRITPSERFQEILDKPEGDGGGMEQSFMGEDLELRRQQDDLEAMNTRMSEIERRSRLTDQMTDRTQGEYLRLLERMNREARRKRLTAPEGETGKEEDTGKEEEPEGTEEERNPFDPFTERDKPTPEASAETPISQIFPQAGQLTAEEVNQELNDFIRQERLVTSITSALRLKKNVPNLGKNLMRNLEEDQRKVLSKGINNINEFNRQLRELREDRKNTADLRNSENISNTQITELRKRQQEIQDEINRVSKQKSEARRQLNDRIRDYISANRRVPQIRRVRKDTALVPDVDQVLEEKPLTPFRVRTLSEVERERQKRRGRGFGAGAEMDGISNIDINGLMYPFFNVGFKGAIPADEIKNIDISKSENPISFIVNTLPADQADEVGHWVAVYIDKDNAQEVDYYDSFAMKPPRSILEQIKYIVDKLSPETYLKFKQNKLRNQKFNSSDACGHHCIRFLLERYKGKPFKEVTGWSELSKDTIKKLRRELEDKDIGKKFNYI